MANTKTVTGSGLRQYGLKLVCSEDSTDITSNTSTISWSLILTSGNYSFGDFWVGWDVVIGVTNVSHRDDNAVAMSISANSSKTIASGTTTVTHNNDGTKTISISGYYSISSAYPGPGDMSCSGDWVLTTIPRASSMTLPSSFTIGSSGSITIQMASSAFSHTITYSGLGLSGTVATLNAGVSSASWTPTTSFYQKLPNSTSGTVTLTLTTKSGSTTIGTKSYDTTIVVPTSIKPTAPSLTLSPVNTNAWISSKGLYVGGYSKLRVRSSASPGSGASVSSYSISGAFSGTGADFTSSVLSAGSKSITVTVTDSRGRSNSTTTSVTFLSYTYPGLTTFTALRGTYSGGTWTTNVNGNHIRVEAVPSVALSANGNTASVTVKIGNTSPSATSGNYYYFTGTNATTSYTITGSVSDSVGNNTSRTLTVSTIEVPLNINVDLPGIGAGMIAQAAHFFEIAPAWRMVAHGKRNVFDYLPYSWYTSVGYGQSGGYARVATIEFGTQVQEEIHIRGSRRTDATAFDLYFQFDGNYNLKTFIVKAPVTSGGTVFEAFAYQTGPKVWDIYVRKAVTNDCITVWVDPGSWSQEDCKITYSSDLRTSVPSGAITAKKESAYTFRVKSRSDMNGVSSSAAANETMRYWKTGNVVTIVVDIVLSSAGTETVIYTLEEQYRPVTTVWGAIPHWSDNPRMTQYWRVNEYGQVVVYCANNSNRLYFNITYAI